MSAERYLVAGLSAYVRGGHQKAAMYCARGLEAAAASDALTVRLVHLYLLSTELWWSVDPRKNITELAERAKAAAARTRDPALAAFAYCMYGRFLLATDSLPEAVAVFAKAADAAAESGNLLAELEALSDLGHHMAGRDLGRSMTILHNAWQRAERSADECAPAFDRPLLPMSRARLAGLIGVGIFDDGRFGEAEGWFRRSLDELRTCRAWDVFASISNYRGQLLTEIGSFEEAESDLQEALRLLRDDADLSTHQGYNLGLLGKLYLEWGRISEAEENIMAGWKRLQGTRHLAVLPILRNYLGELLMHPAYPARDVQHALQLFDQTIAECQNSGFQRSEIAALAFRALACLRTGDQAGADIASARAAEKLKTIGRLPALRAEEVYLVRYEVLSAAGLSTEAAEWLTRADQTLRHKAATLNNSQLRHQFLTRVPTSVKIVSASRSSE